MLTQTLIISLFQPTSSMQSILTSRILAIFLVGLPLRESLSKVRIVTETPMWDSIKKTRSGALWTV